MHTAVRFPAQHKKERGFPGGEWRSPPCSPPSGTHFSRREAFGHCENLRREKTASLFSDGLPGSFSLCRGWKNCPPAPKTRETKKPSAFSLSERRTALFASWNGFSPRSAGGKPLPAVEDCQQQRLMPEIDAQRVPSDPGAPFGQRNGGQRGAELFPQQRPGEKEHRPGQ